MKIALLNLPFDNNYGGNLQRYALIKVLQMMGHEVEHINLVYHNELPWYKKIPCYGKRIVKKYILFEKNIQVFLEKKMCLEMENKTRLTKEFYDKYIPHTKSCKNIADIISVTRGKYSAFIVGSDQVWRADSTKQIGIENYFLRFTSSENVKRYAYSVSFGVSENIFSRKQIFELSKYYSNFNAVSVREEYALELLSKYNWNQPKATLTLDPTFLLSKEDYEQIISENEVVNLTSNKIFCYILDKTKEKIRQINDYQNNQTEQVVWVGLDNTDDVSICQWLNNIKNAKLVITDSFHGCVFSIIFNRSFIFLGNSGRGNSRIDSLFKILDINKDETMQLNWEKINQKISLYKVKSLFFLQEI